MKKLAYLLILALSLQFLSAQEGGSSGGGSSGSSSVSGTYVLRPSDVIRVEVFQEQDLNRDARIAADGTVTLPLIGKVKVGGMMVQDAQQLIRDLYNRDYLVDPHVTLTVLLYTERRVHVHGQVMRPGPVIIPPEEEITFSQAISRAGGLTRLGNGSSIKLTRVEENGQITTININLNEILRGNSSKDIQVKDGDTIFVDERIF